MPTPDTLERVARGRADAGRPRLGNDELGGAVAKFNASADRRKGSETARQGRLAKWLIDEKPQHESVHTKRSKTAKAIYGTSAGEVLDAVAPQLERDITGESERLPDDPRDDRPDATVRPLE